MSTQALVSPTETGETPVSSVSQLQATYGACYAPFSRKVKRIIHDTCTHHLPLLTETVVRGIEEGVKRGKRYIAISFTKYESFRVQSVRADGSVVIQSTEEVEEKERTPPCLLAMAMLNPFSTTTTPNQADTQVLHLPHFLDMLRLLKELERLYPGLIDPTKSYIHLHRRESDEKPFVGEDLQMDRLVTEEQLWADLLPHGNCQSFGFCTIMGLQLTVDQSLVRELASYPLRPSCVKVTKPVGPTKVRPVDVYYVHMDPDKQSLCFTRNVADVAEDESILPPPAR